MFIDDCIARMAAGTLDAATASMAKWWCSDMQGRVIDRCLQLHGGYGYGGANEVMKELIARSL